MRNFRPIQKILVAYRGSQCDQGALEFIAPLFAKHKPEITILHVQETALGETPEFAEACLLTGEDTLKQYGYTPPKIGPGRLCGRNPQGRGRGTL